MKKKEMAHTTSAHATRENAAKIQIFRDSNKDLTKVLSFFRYTIGTTLDCMLGTGVLRNSITWYIVYLQNIGALQVVCRQPDRHTGRLAKHYSADPTQWNKTNCQELTLFEKEEFV